MQSACGNNILALHGFTGCGDDFEALRAHCPPTWRWHCPDLPGHGKNPAPPVAEKFSLAAHLEFLESERRRVFGKEPCVLLGYSMGGRIALHYALQMPEKISAPILISSSPGIADAGEREKRRQSDEALAQAIVTGGVSKFQLRWQSLPLFSGLKKLSPQHREKIRRRRAENSGDGLAASLRGVGTGVLPELWSKLYCWEKPALVIAGSEDEKFSGIAREMTGSGGFRNAMLAIIAGAGHVTHEESPAATARLLIEFSEEKKL